MHRMLSHIDNIEMGFATFSRIIKFINDDKFINVKVKVKVKIFRIMVIQFLKSANRIKVWKFYYVLRV